MKRIGTLLLLATFSLACASTPYPYGEDLETDLTLELQPGESQVERGRPQAVIDGFGHYLFSLPAKLLLLNWKVNNHNISAETEASLREYLDANGLCSVKVRLNQYAPGGEWSRLARNREMPAAWRWTLGMFTVAMYSILPERLLAGIVGGDHYNPYTNTISLYSDLRPVAIHEAGHSKDFAEKRNRHWRGVYAAVRLLPLVPLWQEATASADAISWERAHGSSAEEKSAYRSLYPAYASYVGGEIGRWYGGRWMPYAAAVPGHIAGWTRSFFVEDREPPELDPEIRAKLEYQRCGAAPEPTGPQLPIPPEPSPDAVGDDLEEEAADTDRLLPDEQTDEHQSQEPGMEGEVPEDTAAPVPE
jgi:hypothetical protein